MRLKTKHKRKAKILKRIIKTKKKEPFSLDTSVYYYNVRNFEFIPTPSLTDEDSEMVGRGELIQRPQKVEFSFDITMDEKSIPLLEFLTGSRYFVERKVDGEIRKIHEIRPDKSYSELEQTDFEP